MSKNLYLERGSEEWEKKLEKERARREKKKRRRIKVSGRGVLKLRELISKKGRN
ncbi:hypothetical protein HZB93_02880 [Candidatus Falkowbacteria bacterium]|nr:hypothetical protein [Candidatus Falkowbacteria bacterium]